MEREGSIHLSNVMKADVFDARAAKRGGHAGGDAEAGLRIRDNMKARLYQKYVNEVVPALKEKRKYSNPHQVPRMEKIVVNMGVQRFAGKERGGRRGQGSGRDHRPQAGHQQGAQQHRQFQAARGPGHRLPGHVAARRDV